MSHAHRDDAGGSRRFCRVHSRLQSRLMGLLTESARKSRTCLGFSITIRSINWLADEPVPVAPT